VELADVPAFRLHGALPNPAYGVVSVSFSIGQSPRDVRIRVFDVSGRLVRDFGPVRLETGDYRVRWDGRNDAGVTTGTGIYFVNVDAGETYQETLKVLRLR